MDPATAIINSKFPYQPLEHEDTIRILTLDPANEASAPLECSLGHYTRADSSAGQYDGAHYHAISYVWGEPVLSKQIMLNQKPFFVTANVDDMLRDLRKSYKPRQLWIDAICLNQGNNKEKGQQIPLMKKIYAEAVKVIIWLKGPSQMPERRTMALVRQLDRRRLETLSSLEKHLLLKLLDHPWWKRRFTIQESLVNAVTYVRYCGASIEWRMFSYFLKTLKTTDTAQNAERYQFFEFAKDAASNQGARYTGEHANEAALRNHNALARLRDNWTVPTEDLLDLLWLYHDAECADPRDRIAALQGLAPNDFLESNVERLHPPTIEIQAGWAIRYDLDWRENFKGFALLCLKNDKIDVLTHHLLAFGSLNDADASFPHWVPNWSVPRKSYKVDLGSPYLATMRYLDEFPDMRRELRTYFAPPTFLSQDDPIDGYDCGDIVYVQEPLHSLSLGFQDVLAGVWNLYGNISGGLATGPWFWQFHSLISGNLVSQLLYGLTRHAPDQICGNGLFYPLDALYDFVSDQMSDWLRRHAASNPDCRGGMELVDRVLTRDYRSRIKESHPKEYERRTGTTEHFGGLKADFRLRAVWNDVVEPLMYQRLRSWYFFITDNQAVGCSPVKPSIGQCVSQIKRRSTTRETVPTSWGLVLQPQSTMKPMYNAYASCIVIRGNRIQDSMDSPVKTSVKREVVKVMINEIEQCRTQWLESSPW